MTPTVTATSTSTGTSTATSTVTMTSTMTPTPSGSPTSTPTTTSTPTNTVTPTGTSTSTITNSSTSTPSATPTGSPSSTPTTTSTPTHTVTPTGTGTMTATNSSTSTPTATPSGTTTMTITPTTTSTPSPTVTSTNTSTPTYTVTPTGTSTPSATVTASPTATSTPTMTSTITSTPTPSNTVTPTFTSTMTPTTTATPTQSPSNTTTPTFTSTMTPTTTATPSHTPSSTATSSLTMTATSTMTSTNTPSTTPTSTPSVTPTITQTRTSTPTSTSSSTSTPSPSGTTTQTATPTMTSTPEISMILQITYEQDDIIDRLNDINDVSGVASTNSTTSRKKVGGKSGDYTGSNTTQIPTLTKLNDKDEFTIMMWLHFDASGVGTLFEGNMYGIENGTMKISLVTDLFNNLYLYFHGYYNNTFGYYQQDISSSVFNTWFHLGITYKNGIMAFYIDGQIPVSNIVTTNWQTDFKLISDGFNLAPSYDGYIDMLEIYNYGMMSPEFNVRYIEQYLTPTPTSTLTLTPTMTPTGTPERFNSARLIFQGLKTISSIKAGVTIPGDPGPVGIAFSDTYTNFNTAIDGKYLFILFKSALLRWTLSSNWDITTISGTPQMVTSSGLGMDANVSGFEDLAFNYDGTELYVIQRDDELFPNGYRNDDKVFKYTLSTAWDLTSLTKDTTELWLDPNGSYTNVAGEPRPRALDYVENVFTNDKYLYVSGNVNDKVYRYAFTTWTNSPTATSNQLPLQFFWTGAAELYTIHSIRVSPIGTKLVAIDITDDSLTGYTNSQNMVYQFDFGTQYDVTTLTNELDLGTGVFNELNGRKHLVNATQPKGLYINRWGGDKMFIVDFTQETLYEYSI